MKLEFSLRVFFVLLLMVAAALCSIGILPSFGLGTTPAWKFVYGLAAATYLLASARIGIEGIWA